MPTVTWIPNDPLAVNGPPTRKVRAGRFPSGDMATFSIEPSAAIGHYEQHTPEFDFWQVQTSLIAGLKAWKDHDGKPLRRWFGDQRTLAVLTNAGDDLNAFYDRASLQFFSHTFEGVTVHSAESTDVVVHEQGHAILDAIRPDFFDVPFIEVGALHEAYGDCLAILTALADRAVRESVLDASPDLSANQFLEAVAEQLGDAIRREYGEQSVESGALRHALNAWQWADPASLPSMAPANELSGEVHSFSRVFTGAFYDVIRNVYASGARTPAGLHRAARTTGRLLAGALRAVPATPRVFEGVGDRMVQADVVSNDGANVPEIRAAFEAHGITLAPAAVSMPEPVGRRGRAGERALRERLGVPPRTRLRVTPIDSTTHDREIAHVTAYQSLPLAGEGLEGVRVFVPAVARVVRRGRSITGVLGEVTPVGGEVELEARAFARTLVASGHVRVPPRAARRMAVAPKPPATSPLVAATHEIRIVDGEPTLVRVGFA